MLPSDIAMTAAFIRPAMRNAGSDIARAAARGRSCYLFGAGQLSGVARSPGVPNGGNGKVCAGLCSAIAACATGLLPGVPACAGAHSSAGTAT